MADHSSIERRRKRSLDHTNRQVTKERKQKPNRKRMRKKSPHRGVILLLFFVLTIYLVGYLFIFLTRPSISVETVTYGVIDTPIQLDGLVIREEYVAKSKREGQVDFFYGENERVKKDSVVCNVKDAETSQVLEGQIAKIDKDILKVQKSRVDISPFKDDIVRVENNILQSVEGFSAKLMGKDFSAIYTLRSGVDASIKQRNEIWMAENVDSLSQLSAEKIKYEEQLSQSKTSVKADKSGILSLIVDGQEEVLTPGNLSNITKEQLKMKSEFQYLSKATGVKAEDAVFKIVTDNKWYLVAYVPLEIASDWGVGASKKLSATLKETEEIFTGVITELDIGEKEAKVIFSVTENVIDVIDVRHLEFRLESDGVKGIKVPNTALVEKTLLKLPIDCITENMGETGALKVSGKNTQFIQLNIAKYDYEEGFVYTMQEIDGMRVGDVILKGAEKDAIEYTVSEVSTNQGVYTANSSIATFVIVDVIGENKEVSIVRSGNSNYELRVYDTIISDAKNITEGQKI